MNRDSHNFSNPLRLVGALCHMSHPEKMSANILSIALLPLLFILLFLFAPLFQPLWAQAVAQSAKTTSKTTNKTTAKASPTIKPALNLSGTEVQAAYAVDLESGAVVWQHNADQRLTPASLTKLFSTAAALLTYGPDEQFTTDFLLLPDSNSLVVRGSFDPTTNSRFFATSNMVVAADSVAAALKAQGITSLSSLAQEGSWRTLTSFWPKHLWEDMGNYFGAVPTALMTNDATVAAYFSTPNQPNMPCTLDSLVPQLYDGGTLPNVSLLTTYAGSADKSNFFLAGNLWFAAGQLPMGKKAVRVRAAMPNSEVFYLNFLASLLRDRGIAVDSVASQPIVLCGSPSSPLSSSSVSVLPLYTMHSAPLSDVIRQCNVFSINLVADALAIRLCTQSADRRIDLTEVGPWLANFWKSKIGIEPILYDGSGLAPCNAASPKDFVRLLSFMDQSEHRWKFRESLPVVGKEGTLQALAAKSVVAGKARAKSGTLSGVKCYAGYLTSASNRKLAFCIMVNNAHENNYAINQAVTTWLTQLYNFKPLTHK